MEVKGYNEYWCQSRPCENSPPHHRRQAGLVWWDMAHISGDDRSQLLVLPDAGDDWVGANNPVLFIEAFVDGLTLSGPALSGCSSTRRGGRATIRRIS